MCEHDNIDWDTNLCKVCGMRVYEILAREAYGDDWEKAVKNVSDFDAWGRSLNEQSQ